MLQQRDPKALGRVLWTKPLVFKCIWDLVTFSGFLWGWGWKSTWMPFEVLSFFPWHYKRDPENQVGHTVGNGGF